MKKTILIGLIAMVGLLRAAPASYPVTINSRADSAPPLVAFTASEITYAVTYYDGSVKSDITGATPFFAWSTNSASGVVVPATPNIIGASTGLVEFTFSPANLNYAPGRYMYETGLIVDDKPRIYRQGVFFLRQSPYASGADQITWHTNVIWSSINWVGLPDYALKSDIVTTPVSKVYASDSPLIITVTNQNQVIVNMDKNITVGLPDTSGAQDGQTIRWRFTADSQNRTVYFPTNTIFRIPSSSEMLTNNIVAAGTTSIFGTEYVESTGKWLIVAYVWGY